MKTEILDVRKDINDVRSIISSKRRSLIIGIGGSGKEVILRLRKMFYETLHDPKGYPFIEYLWIDTDPRNKTIMLDDYDMLTNKVMLDKEFDCIDVSIDTQTLKSIYSNIESKKHINSWFSTIQMKKMGYEVLKQGASAIRPFGKLAFWHHSEKIKKQIEKKLFNLRKDFKGYENLAAANDIDVHIIGSLAGGTGSGMFIDLGFMLADIDANLLRNAFLFQSDIFESLPGNHRERMSNNYGALQELDFFMTPANQYKNIGATFNFDWFGNKPNRKVDLPVFTSCYLIGNTYNDGTIDDDFSDPYNIVAEYLFYDFDDSDFSVQKRSVKTNGRLAIGTRSLQRMVVKKNNREYDIPVSFTNSYFAIGLSEIRLNIRKMRLRSSYRFLKDFFGKLTEDNGKNYAEGFYDNNRKFIIDNLDLLSIQNFLRNGKNQTSKVSRELSSLENKVHETKNNYRDIVNTHNIDSYNSIRIEKLKEIDNFFENQKRLFDSKLRNEFEIMGEFIEDINANREAIYNKIVNNIEDSIFKYLNRLDNDNNGYRISEQLLNECEKKVKELSLEINQIPVEECIYSRKSYTNTNYADELIKFKDDLEDIKHIPKLFLGYRSKASAYVNRSMKFQIKSINRNLVTELRDYIEENHILLIKWVESRLNTLIKDNLGILINDLAKRLFSSAENDSLKDNFNKIVNIITDFHDYFKDFEEMFVSRKDNVVKRQWVLDNYINYEEIYKSFIGANRDFHRNIVTSVIESINFKTEYPSEGSLSKLYSLLFDWDVVRQKLDLKECFRKESEKIFLPFMANTNVSSELYKIHRESPEESKSKIAQIKSKAIFKLPLNEAAHPEIRNSMSNSTTKLYASSNIELGQDMFGGDIVFQNHNNPESILIFVEGAGYPLFYVKHTEKLKKAFLAESDDDPNSIYKRYCTRHFGHLYDLMLPESDIQFQNEISALELVIRGIIFGVIKYDEKLNSFYFHHKDEAFLMQRSELGKSLENCARKTIANEDYKKSILDAIDNMKLDLVHYIELWQICRKNKLQTATYDHEVFGDKVESLLSKLNFVFKILVEEFQNQIRDIKEHQGKTISEINKEFNDAEDPSIINFPHIKYFTEVIKDGIFYFEA